MAIRENPYDLQQLDDSVYSNFDHTFDDGVPERLAKGDCYALHAAWNFLAWVWFEEGEWHSYVLRFGSHSGTFHNASLQELVRDVNDKFGDA